MESRVLLIFLSTFLTVLFCHVRSAFSNEWVEHSYANQEVRELAQWSLYKLKGNDEDRSFEIIDIKNIETQICYGVNYKFTIDVRVKDSINHETVSFVCTYSILFDLNLKLI